MLMKANNKAVKLLAVAGALAVLSGCSLIPKEEEALKPPLVVPVKENFELYEVKPGDITKKFTAVATFASSETTSLYYKQSGQRLEGIKVKLGDEVKAGDVVAELEKGDLETRIKLQKLNLERAQLASVQTLQDDPNNARAIRLKQIDVEAAQIELASLQEQLDKTKLVATKSGVVTFLNDIKQGEFVDAFTTMVKISDPSQIQLVYEAPNSSDLAGIQVGMEVEIKLSNSGATAKGKVLQSPTSAAPTDNKEQNDRNAKTVIVGIDKGLEGAKIGAYADITVTLEKREKVLIIPRVGLRSYLGRDYVQVLEGESRKEVDVEKGLVTPTEVEIRKGLMEGQKIILNN